MFYKSMNTGQFKTVNSVPIFKIGDRQEEFNYRPVSLTYLPCKIMEKVVGRRVVEHLERSNFISNN